MDDLDPVTDPRIEWLSEVDSTNRLARDGVRRHGDVLASTNQTAGRGRLDRTWTMVPGRGVAMTVVVRLPEVTRWPTRLPLLAACAVVDAVRGFAGTNIDMTIKWPNDVLVGDAKLAGILVESLSDGLFAVGIGVNLTASRAELPVDTATSLALEGVRVDSHGFVTDVSRRILDAVSRIDDDATLAELSELVATLGRTVRIELPDGSTRTGVAESLGTSGSLAVRIDGELAEFVAGDVTHLRAV